MNWEDKRKHIVFQNIEGKKVRDTNLSKTFSIDINKDSLIKEFEKQRHITGDYDATQKQRHHHRSIQET